MGSSNYYLQSLKWHAARFFKNPDRKTDDRNGMLLITSCMLAVATAGYNLADVDPAETAPDATNEQSIQDYQTSLSYLEDLHDDLYKSERQTKRNALPGVPDVSPVENPVTEGQFQSYAIDFLGTTLTDRTLSEQNVSELLEAFEDKVAPMDQFGFRDIGNARHLNEAQEKYQERYDSQTLPNDDAEKISEIARDMDIDEYFIKFMVILFGGGLGGLGLASSIFSLATGGRRENEMKELARKPKPTRHRSSGYKH